jgi:ankyrin repeat protein
VQPIQKRRKRTYLSTADQFFNAVRSDDARTVRRLVTAHPELAQARWPGRAGDGRIRSLGPSPYSRHAWLTVPDLHEPDDPRFTSAPVIYTRNDEILQLLLAAGADVNAKGTSGDLETPDWFYTPLWRAAHDGRLASVRLLVEHGADIDYRDPDGCNQALKTAAENGRLEVCEYLLTRIAMPDLITASMLGLAVRVEAILAGDRQAIHARDGHGRSALDAATLLDSYRVRHIGLHAGHDQTAEILIARGATVDLEHAASLGLLDRVRGIVQQDPEVLTRPRSIKALLTGAAIRESPLCAAKRRNRTEVVSYLLRHGAVNDPPVLFC